MELLQLDHVAVTDAGLPSLLQMQQLRWLELLNMPHLSEAGAKQFNIKKLTAVHVKIQADDRTVRARRGEVPTCAPREPRQLFWWETGAPVRVAAPRAVAAVVDMTALSALVDKDPMAAFSALNRAAQSSSSSSPSSSSSSSLLALATRVARHLEDRLTSATKESLRDALGSFSSATGIELVLDDDLDEGVSQATAALQEWVAGFRG